MKYYCEVRAGTLYGALLCTHARPTVSKISLVVYMFPAAAIYFATRLHLHAFRKHRVQVVYRQVAVEYIEQVGQA